MSSGTLLEAQERAHRLAIGASSLRLSSEVADRLGHRLTAYLIGLDSTEALDRLGQPSSETVDRLRLAYEVCRLLEGVEPPRVVQAWMLGMNPFLDDVAPARMIREGGRQDEVLRAAGEFWLRG